jgi:hypothetical protein
MKRIRLAVILVALSALTTPLVAHPHRGDVVTDTFRGRLTEVNFERRTIAIDAIDRKTKKLRTSSSSIRRRR